MWSAAALPPPALLQRARRARRARRVPMPSLLVMLLLLLALGSAGCPRKRGALPPRRRPFAPRTSSSGPPGPLARWASSATISASSCAACAACARTATVCARTAAISRAVCASACFCALRLRACCSISVASSCVLPGLGDLGCRRPVLIAQLGVGPRLQQSPRACLVALVSRVHQGGGGAAAAPLIRVGMVPQENAQEGKVATSRSSHERGATAAVRQVDARAAPQQLPRQP